MLRALALIAVAAALSGCRGKSASESGITVIEPVPPDTLDGRMAVNAYAGEVIALISPGLIRFDDSLQPQGDLAESFVRVDDLTWKFVLRENLTFHDGSPVTSDDVKATFENLKALSSPKTANYSLVDRIEAVDARTVVFHLKEPYAPLLAELTLSIVPKARAVGDGAKLQDKAPIGAGPFKFVSRPDEDHVELAPFDRYYKGAPKMSAVHIRVVRDETTRVLELLKGRADLVNVIGPPVIPVLSSSENVEVHSVAGLSYAYLLPNVRTGPLSDVRVRQAICHGIDIQTVVNAKFHGLASPATGFLPASHWAYQKTEGCTFDPERAKRLLDEAGFKDPDGDGPLPRVVISYKTSTDRFRKSIALVFREQLKAIGVELDVRALEFGTLFGDIKKGNFELTSLKWSTVFEPDLMRQVFTTSAIPDAKNNYVGLNRGGFSNAQLDAVLKEATTSGDPERRKALYQQAQVIVGEQLPYISLWHEKSSAVTSKKLQGFVPDSSGGLRPLEDAREVTVP